MIDLIPMILNKVAAILRILRDTPSPNPVNSVRPFNSEDSLLYIKNEVWMKSGIIDTDSTSYPEAATSISVMPNSTSMYDFQYYMQTMYSVTITDKYLVFFTKLYDWSTGMAFFDNKTGEFSHQIKVNGIGGNRETDITWNGEYIILTAKYYAYKISEDGSWISDKVSLNLPYGQITAVGVINGGLVMYNNGTKMIHKVTDDFIVTDETIYSSSRNIYTIFQIGETMVTAEKRANEYINVDIATGAEMSRIRTGIGQFYSAAVSVDESYIFSYQNQYNLEKMGKVVGMGTRYEMYGSPVYTRVK